MAMAISHMKKEELTEELTRTGHKVNPKWTVPELRELVREVRQTQQKGTSLDVGMKGISSMNKSDLVKECERRGIPMSMDKTRGYMILTIRDVLEGENTSGFTLMTFGKHRGMTFKETYEDKPRWVDWAVEEVHKNSESSPALKQFVDWVLKVRAGQVPLAPEPTRPKAIFESKSEGPEEAEGGTSSASSTRQPTRGKRGGGRTKEEVIKMEGEFTKEARDELARMKARVVELEALHKEWAGAA